MFCISISGLALRASVTMIVTKLSSLLALNLVKDKEDRWQKEKDLEGQK